MKRLAVPYSGTSATPTSYRVLQSCTWYTPPVQLFHCSYYAYLFGLRSAASSASPVFISARCRFSRCTAFFIFTPFSSSCQPDLSSIACRLPLGRIVLLRILHIARLFSNVISIMGPLGCHLTPSDLPLGTDCMLNDKAALTANSISCNCEMMHSRIAASYS